MDCGRLAGGFLSLTTMTTLASDPCRSGLDRQLFEDFERLCTGDALVSGNKRWHAGNPKTTGLFPVCIHDVSMRAGIQHTFRVSG